MKSAMNTRGLLHPPKVPARKRPSTEASTVPAKLDTALRKVAHTRCTSDSAKASRCGLVTNCHTQPRGESFNRWRMPRANKESFASPARPPANNLAHCSGRIGETDSHERHEPLAGLGESGEKWRRRICRARPVGGPACFTLQDWQFDGPRRRAIQREEEPGRQLLWV